MSPLILPNFLIIGAQKAATTAIYYQLRAHPDVFMPERKEIAFFTSDYIYHKGLKYYSSQFHGWQGEKAIGEATPDYLYKQEAPKRISKALPTVKLIACLRDPIDRAYSAYVMQLSKGSEPMNRSFEEVVLRSPEYLEHGRYVKQLERYLKFFSLDQICVLLYEEIKSNAKLFYSKVFHFLEIDPIELTNEDIRRDNLGGIPSRAWVQYILNILYRSRNCMRVTPLGWVVSNAYTDGISRKMRNRIAGWNRIKGQYPKLNPEVRERLLPLVSEYNDSLSDLIGMDLSIWNKK